MFIPVKVYLIMLIFCATLSSISSKLENNIDDQKHQHSIVRRGVGIKHKKYRWPKDAKGKVIVPYEFSSESNYSNLKFILENIQLNMFEIHS